MPDDRPLDRDPSPRRVLAAMAHPDDLEFLCAGTLMRLREAGFEVHVATMTPGDKGTADRSREAIAAVRREEARKGAASLGAASCTCLEFADLEILFDAPARRRVAGLLRRVDPEVVFTLSPDDYMFDHTITSMLVRDACFNASVPNADAEGGHPPASRVPYLYYCDPVGGHDAYGAPAILSCLVDISAQVGKKTAALACHASQREWLRRQHGVDDYLESMRRHGARRGAAIGVAFAEGFRQHRGHPHPADDLLARVLSAVPVSGATPAVGGDRP